MIGFVHHQRLAAISAAGAIALLAGCASAPDYQRVSYGGPYIGADRINERDHVHDTRPGLPLEAPAPVQAAYYGVEGARMAHMLFGLAEAERLDGVCPREVKILRGETLDDIAEYCDAPVSTLIAFNPGVRHARDVVEGQTIVLPRAYARLADVGIADAASVWYLVQEGDTIENIAARYETSAVSLSVLNPEIDWRLLPVDGFIRVPASAPGGAPVAADSRIENNYPSSSEYDSSPEFAPSAEATSVMPYNLTPSRKSSVSAGGSSGVLTVDRRSVAPGGSVTVSAVDLPRNSEVTIYRGSNGRDLEPVKTVRTDSEGRFSESVLVKKSSNFGGVIFRATVDGSREDLQSPRVGVDGLDISDEPADEDSQE